MFKWVPAFDPDDTKDYVANWTPEMTARADTISVATFVIDTATTGIDVASTVIDATEKKAIAWITATDKTKAALLAGQTITVAHSITTVGGRVLNKTLGLKIKEL